MPKIKEAIDHPDFQATRERLNEELKQMIPATEDASPTEPVC